MHCHGQQAIAVGVLALNLCFKRDLGQRIQIGENVGIAGLAAPVEVRRDKLALSVVQIQLQEMRSVQRSRELNLPERSGR